MNDETLLLCNKAELLTIAVAQGLPRLSRAIPKEVMIDIITGRIDPGPEHLSATMQTRFHLERSIQNVIDLVRHQLPGCNGMCTVFRCTEARHALCFLPNKESL